MKNKNNNDVIQSFKNIIEEHETPERLITDSESAFIGSEFQALLKKNNIIHDVVVIGDHTALGIIDRFARTLKNTLSKIFLRTDKVNWIDYLDKVIDNYNNSPHSSLGDIAPNHANDPDNLKVILDINDLKNLKNNTVNDLNIGDKVRLSDKNIFLKGTEGKFSDEVYKVEKVNGKTITLNNGQKVKRNNLLHVPINTHSSHQNIIRKTNEDNKRLRYLKNEAIDPSNVITERRKR
jgi:hypothetical protein